MKFNLKKALIIISVLLFSTINVIGANAYKNELIRVGFSPLGVNDVKITLYTSKPYSEPLRLLKKNDSEFVLILPETYNSAPQKPSISDVIGEVTDADIKLYSFISNSMENGYTKIVIRTNGSINLYPEAVAIGGGSLANIQDYNKVVYSPPKTAPSNNIQVIKAQDNKEVKISKPENQVVSKEKNAPKQEVKQVAKKENKVEPKKEVKNTVANAVNNTNTIKPEKNENIQPKEQVVEVAQLPTLTEESVSPVTENVQVPLEEITQENVNGSVEKSNSFKVFLSKVKNKITTSAKKSYHFIKNNFNNLGNILLLLAALVLLGMSAKFGYAIVKSAKPRKDEENVDKSDVKNSNDGQYSSFFKTLIDSEVNGSNAFRLNAFSENESDAAFVEESSNAHKDVMNIDQNLSWQEKFRAVQRNKKELFRDDEIEKAAEDMGNKLTPEMEENMNIENPIKKLKQDFRAVKKVLEKQKDTQTLSGDAPIEQKFVPEKIEKVEVVSFDDYQKEIEPPKVQVKTTMPLKSNPPKVVSQLPLADDKGLYLIAYKDKIALIGYIKDKVFKLNTYSSLTNKKLYARLSESENGRDSYIVKFDNNKMIIDVSEEKMQLKLVY